SPLATSHQLLLLSSLPVPLPPSSTLFPYTTLFRSGVFVNTYGTSKVPFTDGEIAKKIQELFDLRPYHIEQNLKLRFPIYSETARSEEHTSELQSRENLVCRLLLEKKKISIPTNVND